MGVVLDRPFCCLAIDDEVGLLLCLSPDFGFELFDGSFLDDDFPFKRHDRMCMFGTY